jgi:uncharacterized membrane-anchored protein
MNMSSKMGLWLTTTIWLAIIGWMWAQNHFHLLRGTEIILRTVPVDPRDLFRGDYVVLRYEISDLHLDTLAQPEFRADRNTDVYVALQESNGYWQAVRVARHAPATPPFIKGRVTSVSSQSIRVSYGIESYFVPEGKGKEIEDQMRKGVVAAVVVLDDRGSAKIKDLILDAL